MKRKFGMTALMLAALALAGCIEVKDFTAAWMQAAPDPMLEGRWKMQQLERSPADPAPVEGEDAPPLPEAKYFTFESAGDHYRLLAEDDSADEPMVVKTLTLGGQRVLMLYEAPPVIPGEIAEAPATMEGDLWPYNLNGDAIEFTRLSDEAAPQVEELSGGLIDTGSAGDQWYFSIDTLDADAQAALARLLASSELWSVWAKGERVVEEAE